MKKVAEFRTKGTLPRQVRTLCPKAKPLYLRGEKRRHVANGNGHVHGARVVPREPATVTFLDKNGRTKRSPLLHRVMEYVRSLLGR